MLCVVSLPTAIARGLAACKKNLPSHLKKFASTHYVEGYSKSIAEEWPGRDDLRDLWLELFGQGISTKHTHAQIMQRLSDEFDRQARPGAEKIKVFE